MPTKYKKGFSAAKSAAVPQATGRGGTAFGASSRTQSKIIDIPATVDFFKKNPAEAAKLYVDLVRSGTPGGMAQDFAKAVLERDAVGAGLVAAGMVPVGGGAFRGAAAAAKTARVAGAAAKAAGKTRRAVAADAAKAAARRTKAESATIAAGTRSGRTAEVAKKLERQEAQAAASKSVNQAPRSSVTPRTDAATGELPKGITQKRIAEFSTNRGGRIAANAAKNIKRTPAQAKRAQADLADSLKRGAQARAEGRKPGEDIPGYTGRGINDPAPAPRTIKPTPKQADREAVSKALTKPKWNGKESSRAKYENDLAAYNKRQAEMKAKTKDIDEGRRKVTGELKGASAKSARRQEEKRAKNAAAVAKTKKPSAKKPKVGTDLVPVRKPAGPTTAAAAERAAARTTGTDVATRNSALARRNTDVVQGRVIKGGRNQPPQREPIDLKTWPAGQKPKAIGRPGNLPARRAGLPAVRPQGTVAKRGSIAAIEAGAKKKDYGKYAALLGAAGVAGAGAMMLAGSDAGKKDEAAKPAAAPAKPKAKDYVRDNKGRKISREEFEKRQAFREKFGLAIREGESRTDYRKRVEAWKAKNKKRTRLEMKRRANYRDTEGKKRFGEAARAKSRKSGARRVQFDSDARKALR